MLLDESYGKRPVSEGGPYKSRKRIQHASLKARRYKACASASERLLI